MSDDLKPLLAKVADGASLTVDEAETAFTIIMSGQATEAQIGAFLMAGSEERRVGKECRSLWSPYR